MAWTSPRTWADGETPTGALLNTHLRDNLNELEHPIGYTEFTSPVSVTATVEATPTDIVSAGTITFDGNPVWVEFYYPYFQLPPAAGGALYLTLWNDTTQIGRFAASEAESTTVRTQPGGTFKRKITPTAADHVLKVSGFVSSGTAVVGAGAGTSITYEPGYIRIYSGVA